VLLNDRIAVTSVRRAGDAAELHKLLEEAPWFPHLPVIVQEYVPGHGAGVFCLYDEDHALAWFAHRRLREKPPSGGVSVLCESVSVDPVLREHAESLLRAARYRGVAMVEFRIGSEGRPYIMEVNARFWGSLQLAIDCGVDFPWLCHQMMMGSPVVPVTNYAVGRRLRWLFGDLDNLVSQLRDPTVSVANRLQASQRFAATMFDRGCRQEVFRWSDPAPGLREARQWLAATLGIAP
jgi:predicted ATP-grasp superfamily ATP-dependent carboligase